MVRTLVSLVSDQTIPNILMIKELFDQIDRYVFISTTSMEEKGCRGWIEKNLGIADRSKNIVIDAYSPVGIQKLLSENFPPESLETVRVNVTGGTKITSLVCNEFFRGCTRYYVVTRGGNSSYIVLNTGKVNNFKTRLSVADYLKGYGFEVRFSHHRFDATPEYLEYLKRRMPSVMQGQAPEFRMLRSWRSKKEPKREEAPSIFEMLDELNFPYHDHAVLSKKEIQFITGDWFEDYIAMRLRKEGIVGDMLASGLHLNRDSTANEFDVVFMKDNQLYVIECKSSVMKEDSRTILGETIYKADSLNSRFGTFAKYFICTLDSKATLKKRSAGELDANEKRAKLSRIKLIFGEDLADENQPLLNLLGIC